MSNTKRGLIDIELDGKIRQLRYPGSIMRQLQERFAVKTPNEVWGLMTQWGPDDWTFAIMLGLQKGSEPGINYEQADDIVLGTETLYYMATIIEAVNSATTGRVTEKTQHTIDKAMDAAENKVIADAGGQAANPH